MAVQGNESVDAGYFAEVEDLFFDALDLPSNQRETWLQGKCQGRQAIYTEVQTLLEAHISSESFLSESPDLTGIAACPDLSGRRLGSYKVEKEIAKGGMGRVYSADRVDGEYQQRVAIKVVELGNVEAELFRRERQTLANLEYPNIVTLLDGGTLEEGFPYLVMELVEGQAIDHYSIDHSLDKKDLLNLFSTLCEVVGRAHEQNVIHCDLKPANILVTESGILKLLDFGISQTLIKTQDAQKDELRSQALTPEYASPQRQAHETPHITDDVYSLGIILGQLLIGESLPRVATEFLVKKRYKKIDIEQLLLLIPHRELRMIIKKATHDESDKRYQAADDLAVDLQNWLHDRPVEAVSGGKKWQFYSLYKNLIRNRLFLGILVGSLVLLGVGAYYWNKQKIEALNAEAAATAKRVSTDLAGVISRTHPSIDIQAELTGLAVQNIEKAVAVSMGNTSAIHDLAESLLFLGQLEGHPLYLSKEDFESSSYYFLNAVERLERLNTSLMVSEQPAGIGDDLVNQQVVQFDLLRAKRMLGEIELYTKDKLAGTQQLLSIEKSFKQVSFTLNSRKQILSYMSDLLAWSHFNLLQKNYSTAKEYLSLAATFVESVLTVKITHEQDSASATSSRNKLTRKEKLQAQEKQNEVERIAREKQDLLKKARFLRASIAEQLGYIAFMKGEYKSASQYLLSVGDNKTTDIHMTPLMNRVNQLQACIALVNKNQAIAKQLHEKIRQHSVGLLDDHPSAERLRFRLERLTNKSLSLKQQLDCHEPENIIFPLRQLTLIQVDEDF